ncbi:hypothetical protein O0I10_000634 [Lichtheimia ornata]|uniref:CAP-Gly domain-containing protein n=1 Tax=Lichtheimia ornata TaxID=688661 RepID=A0AAD7Y431_9FUNG|nr:uncharacterized protein O0I10_000634 [Lichtheimia ornata]KAJ8663395.1 hypothetical protein O0I10_000634 [Lichtheimia ornata]
MSIHIGDRIQIGSDLATVRFYGQVEGTKGEWIGVEWDDPTRGKHDGSHQGTRYFTSTNGPTSCSFIRPHPTKVITGRPFLDALKEKYLVDEDHKEEDVGHVYFGGNKDLVVETVGFGKIEREQRNLSNLKVVGLADQQINTAGEPGIIAEHRLSIHDLDLSKNLLSSWDALSEITKQLPELMILRLNHCRLEPPSTSIDHAAFSSITTLGLSSTKTPWLTIMQLEPLLPALEDLQLGKNEIQHLTKPDSNQFPRLKCINLEDNEISSWDEIAKLGCLQSLDILYLNGNKIPSIQPIEANTFPKLEFLRVDNNQIKDWGSLDVLNALSSLRRLRCKGNPIVAPLSREQAMLQIVSRIKNLTIVDGNTVTPRERVDFERYYLKLCTKDGSTHQEIARLHPRFSELCQIHGEPDMGEKKAGATTLNDRLIQLTFSLRPSMDDVSPVQEKSQLQAAEKSIEKRVLGTMKIRNLRQVIQKLLRVPATRQRLYLIQNGAQDHEMLVTELEDDLRDLHFYSAAAGDDITIVQE